MRLQPVTGTWNFRIACLKCGKEVASSDAVADLEGTPFQAYYHKTCGLLLDKPKLTVVLS